MRNSQALAKTIKPDKMTKAFPPPYRRTEADAAF